MGVCKKCLCQDFLSIFIRVLILYNNPSTPNNVLKSKEGELNMLCTTTVSSITCNPAERLSGVERHLLLPRKAALSKDQAHRLDLFVCINKGYIIRFCCQWSWDSLHPDFQRDQAVLLKKTGPLIVLQQGKTCRVVICETDKEFQLL